MTSKSFKEKLNNLLHTEVPKGYTIIEKHARENTKQDSKDKNSITS